MSHMREPVSVLHNRFDRSGPIRQAVESFVLLAIAVVLFRGFALEGYLISTGSMAPTLLGYHHRVTCPECNHLFAHGAAFTEDRDSLETARAAYEDLGGESPPLCWCPNCGRTEIVAATVPRTEGDQLLVVKHAYEFRDPRRWEVVVFRNPGDPRQAYVKRVVGLPGERIDLVQGEVLADGRLCRKPYLVQEGLKILVADYSRQAPPGDPDCRPRWLTASSPSRWTLHERELRYDGLNNEADLHTDWVEYRHWISAGGSHTTEVELSAWPERVEKPQPAFDHLAYEEGTLKCTGVLTDVECRRWLSRTDNSEFRRAFQELFERSHEAPITDGYGYNPSDPAESFPVSDLMLSLTIDQVQGDGRFELQLQDGHNTFLVVLDIADGQIELLRNDDPLPVREGRLKRELLQSPLDISFSLFDHQATLAINQQLAFPSFEYDAPLTPREQRRPARIGAAKKLACRVTNLALYRDIYYTPKPAADQNHYQLAAGDFIVLGDNSPVSVDSRVWDDPALPRTALIGKPLVVHLPSRTGQVYWHGASHSVRIPDFSRVRVVR